MVQPRDGEDVQWLHRSFRTRAKAKPKYQSKKKPSLKWSGRGMMPVWMRDEMKGTNLKKDSFLIE